MKITVISVGKKHDPKLADAINDYQKRLERWVKIEWLLLPPSKLDGEIAREKESEMVLEHLANKKIVWLLDEIGQQLSTTQLASNLKTYFDYSTDVIIVIGGAYGVNKVLRERADFVWSLSRLTLPHQLVRLVLIEQLYRAISLNHGSKYHHK